jgi:membrane-bound lytic murein transglycosylase A
MGSPFPRLPLLRRLAFLLPAAVAAAAMVAATVNADARHRGRSRSYDRHADHRAATRVDKADQEKAASRPAQKADDKAPAGVGAAGPAGHGTVSEGHGPATAEPLHIADAELEPARWSELDGWVSDDHASAFATFQASCRPIVRSNPGNDERPVRAGLERVCARAIKAGALDGVAARRFFEDNFMPIRIRKLGDQAGFLTGYYEPVVDGSRVPTREFTVPLYRRPPDLIAAGATQPGGPFPNTGKAYRRTRTGELVPYYDRGEIEDGALDGRHLEICWLRSATEALFISIQGSARVRLEDGEMLRLNYDAHNGYPYVPVGRVLIERNIIPREEMSMSRIRDWMQSHPDEAKEVRRQNRSMIFFRIVGLSNEGEALGAQGIPLSAGRSIAVDKALHVYGTPFFIAADLPIASSQPSTPFRRTMIAQDTGSAIVGPARADLYFGAGDQAGLVAGRVRQPGQFAMLLPRDLDPVAAGIHMPLPRSRPVPPAPPAAMDHGHQDARESSKESSKAESARTEPESPSAGKTAAKSTSKHATRLERGRASRRLVR